MMTNEQLAEIEAGHRRRLDPETQLPHRWMYSAEAIRAACSDVDILLDEVSRQRQLIALLLERLRILQPSIQEVFEQMRKAGGDAWDKIEDPEAFIRELRGYD